MQDLRIACQGQLLHFLVILLTTEYPLYDGQTYLDTLSNDFWVLLLMPDDGFAELRPFPLRTNIEETEMRKHIRQAVVDEGASKRPPVHRVELVDSF